MGRYTIGIVGRDRNENARCFEEFASALRDALRTLGHEVVDFERRGGRIVPGGRLIAIGLNNVRGTAESLPDDTIIFNAEQLAAIVNPRTGLNDPRLLMENWVAYREHVVWDYSAANINALRQLGFKRAVHCPLGFISSMRTIAPAEQDIDVLHFGSMRDRRRRVLDEVRAAGLRVVHLFNVYGEARDEFIARAKVVVNIHYYPGGVFEIFRVSHLLANGKCVVSESGGCDAELEAFAERSCTHGPIDGIASECIRLVADDRARAEAEERGRTEFEKLDFITSVDNALASS